MSHAKKIATMMAERFNLTPTKISEPDYEVDGEIVFKEFPEHHIQVGEGYIEVVREMKTGPGEFDLAYHFTSVKTLHDAFNALKDIPQ